MKGTLKYVFLICAGVVVGSLVSSLTAGISWLSWLSFGKVFGLTSPFVLNLGVINLTFGMTIDFNIAVLICVTIALIIGGAIKSK